MKKLAITALKWGVSLGILAYLVMSAARDESFAQLREEPKDWRLIFVAGLIYFLAVVVTMVRWCMLVRAAGMPFKLRDAFRLGFLGFLLNFVSVGAVGGDLFKAVFIAREQPGRRTAAVVSVALDRLLGLYALFLVPTIVILVTGLYEPQGDPTVRMICQATFACAAAITIGLVIALLPGVTHGPISRFVTRLPRTGRFNARVLEAVRIYRRRIPQLGIAVLMSCCVHASYGVAFFLLGHGLLREPPSLVIQMVAVPLAMGSGILPLPLSGLGGFEYLLAYLYQHLPTSVHVTTAQALLVALTYRCITVAVAIVGAGIYLSSRREVAEVMHQAEVEEGDDVQDEVVQPMGDNGRAGN